MAVLDVGSGLGGPARILAEEFGCMVTGIDLTPVYVEIAGKLSQLVGLQHQTRFQVASALELPFAGESFDRVWTQHVQMNIEDKPALYRELKRVLIPGGRLIFYDIFKGTTKGVIYPTPWSDRGFNSHLFHISDLQKILKSLGFTSLYQEDHTEFGIDFFQNQMKAAPSGNKPKLALHLLMGDQGSIKLKNVLQNLQNAAIELHSGIFRKSA